MPFVIWSSSADSSLLRALSDDAVKKLVGLSSALLTFLPVAKRFWVWLTSAAVFCRASRFERTPALRVSVPAMFLTFLVDAAMAAVGRSIDRAVFACRPIMARKKTWLMEDETKYTKYRSRSIEILSNLIYEEVTMNISSMLTIADVPDAARPGRHQLAPARGLQSLSAHPVGDLAAHPGPLHRGPPSVRSHGIDSLSTSCRAWRGRRGLSGGPSVKTWMAGTSP